MKLQCHNAKCDHVEARLPAYAVAQLSMGNDIKFTCPKCSTVRVLKAQVYQRLFKQDKQVRDAVRRLGGTS